MAASGKMGSARRQILLVEDHPMMRERLAEVIGLERDLVVCGEAEDCAGALRLAQQHRPDLIIVDLTLKQSHGLDLIKELQEQQPSARILVVSMHDESLHAERVLRAGAQGYITKQQATRTILKAIRTVLEGSVYLSEAMMLRLATNVAGRARSRERMTLDALTDRELRVFELLGQGLGTRQVAERLGVKMRTVETYRARIRQKLNLKDGLELLRHAIRWTDSGPRDALTPPSDP